MIFIKAGYFMLEYIMAAQSTQTRTVDDPLRNVCFFLYMYINK